MPTSNVDRSLSSATAGRVNAPNEPVDRAPTSTAPDFRLPTVLATRRCYWA